MSENPHIFHLITRLIDGGAVNALLPIATDLDKYDITVGYGSEVDKKYVNQLRTSNVETRQFPLIRHYNPITAGMAVLTVANYIRKNDFDIVHTHSTEAGIIGRAAAKIAGTAHIVHTVHGVPFADDRNDMLNWFIERCEVRAAKWTDVIVSIADIIKQDYLSRGIGESGQYKTVEYGIRLDDFRTAAPANDLSGSGVRVLMVSRLASGKGFNVLFDAVENLDIDGFTVLIAGDGPLRDDLNSQIESRGIDRTVSLLGYRDDIPEVMTACDLLVLPSFREGTPFVITEAMAAGLPVVATNIAGIPEQVDDGTTGILIEPGDPDSLAAAIERLVTSSDLRDQYGAAAQERAKVFSVDRMVADYSSLYQDLLSQ